MSIDFGPVPANSTLPIFFASYDANGASVTLTGLAVTDIEIYKGGSITQRASDNGYTLIDTDGIDVDSITGLHGFTIDLSDNSDSGFYAVGSFYTVVVSAVTISSQTVTFIAATFRIVAAESVTGKPKVDVDAWLGTAAATPTVAGVPEVDVTHWIGTAAATPTTAGVPEVDITFIAGSAVSTSSAQIGVNVVNAAGTAWGSGAITAASIATGAIDADALAADASTEIRSVASGTADSGTTTTMVDAARTEADTDYWKGNIILFTSGTIAGQARLITAFTPASDTITFAPAVTQAVGTNTYEILPAGRADVELWDGSAVNALISGRVDINIGAVQTAVLTASGFAADCIGASELAADAVAEISAAVWAEAARTLTAATNITSTGGSVPITAGGLVSADVTGISTDTTAADNLEALLDGTGGVTITGALSGAVGSVTGNVGGNVTGSVGSVAAGGITASSIAADAIGASELAADAVAEIAAGVWDLTTTGHTTAGTFGEQVKTDIDAILDDTGTAGVVVGSLGTGAISASTFAAGAIDAAALAADAGTELADALLKRDMSAVTGEAARSPLNALRALRNKRAISGATLTVYKEDDSTSAWTATLTTSASADPITAMDPA